MLNKFKQFFRQSDEHEFKPLLAEIEDAPTSPLGRVTYWLIAATLIFAVLWMCLGEIDVVVSARGNVIPEGNVKIMQPLQTGVVREILVKPGDFVKAGEPLMMIDPTTTEPEALASKNNLKYLDLETQRIQANIHRRPFAPKTDAEPDADELSRQHQAQSLATQQHLHQAAQRRLDRELHAQQEASNRVTAQMASKRSQIEQHQSLLDKATEREARLSKVLDIIARKDYTDVQKEIVTHSKEIERLSHEIEELVHQQSQIEAEMGRIQSEFDQKLLDELATKEKQIVDYEAKAVQSGFINERQTIASPVDGYVNELFIHTVGGVVTPAEKLISIVPKDEPLLIKARVQNQDIGFVDETMPTAIKLDTFSFQKYGTLKGQVLQIAHDSKTDPQHPDWGEYYEVLIRPLQLSLLVDGRKEFLNTGLSVTADIKVGKRKIIEFFIYPIIKYLNEGMSVR